MSSKIKNEIFNAALKANKAALHLQQVLQKAFPVGSKLKFYIKTGQKKPSIGRVVGHHKDGTVRCIHTGSPTGQYRSVPWQNIVFDETEENTNDEI